MSGALLVYDLVDQASSCFALFLLLLHIVLEVNPILRIYEKEGPNMTTLMVIKTIASSPR